MARPIDDLAAQVAPGRASPDYAGEQINRGADEVLARQSTGHGFHAQGKVSSGDANYVEPGPAPFQCGQCRYIVWGTSRPGKDGNDPEPTDDIDLCQIVEGPHDGGGIKPEGACRFFAPKPLNREYPTRAFTGPDSDEKSTLGTRE